MAILEQINPGKKIKGILPNQNITVVEVIWHGSTAIELFYPRDVSKDNLGYDIESLDSRTGRLRFVEVKGRREGAETVTVTRNEILTGFNSAENYYLVIVEVSDGKAGEPVYLQSPFGTEPDFGVTSVNYDISKLLSG